MENKELNKFLLESNAIEGVYDFDSLKQARLAWDYLISQDRLTIRVVLETHKILMKNQPLEEKYKGKFRKCEVYIGGHIGVSWLEVPFVMRNWLMWQKPQDKRLSKQAKTEYAKQNHVDYEKIHPFADGNGRTGRMFLNWWRIKNGLPLLIIRESKKRDYYKWFEE